MSKWLTQLRKKDGAVNFKDKTDIRLKTKSPGINYLFGKKGGMKAGYSMLLYGPAKSGKSLISMAYAGELHRTDPDAIVLHFDTEMRSNLGTWTEAFGIDPERIVSYATNKPDEIFDFIANDVAAMIQEGAPIKMIIIDSLAGLLYPKEANKESSTDFVMGDAGAYLAGALKMILPVVRNNSIATILCQHVRENFDPSTAKYRPFVIPCGRALKHFAEYFTLVQKIQSKDSAEFSEQLKDGAGNAITTGHTIRVKMEESSDGPSNRSAEIFLDYAKGFTHAHVEIAELCKNMGIVERPNNTSYVVDGVKYVGFGAFCSAIKDDEELRIKLINKLRENDPL